MLVISLKDAAISRPSRISPELTVKVPSAGMVAHSLTWSAPEVEDIPICFPRSISIQPAFLLVFNPFIDYVMVHPVELHIF